MIIFQNNVRHFLSCNFFLDKKVTKKSRNNDAIPPQGLPTPAVFSGLRSFRSVISLNIGFQKKT